MGVIRRPGSGRRLSSSPNAPYHRAFGEAKPLSGPRFPPCWRRLPTRLWETSAEQPKRTVQSRSRRSILAAPGFALYGRRLPAWLWETPRVSRHSFDLQTKSAETPYTLSKNCQSAWRTHSKRALPSRAYHLRLHALYALETVCVVCPVCRRSVAASLDRG